MSESEISLFKRIDMLTDKLSIDPKACRAEAVNIRQSIDESGYPLETARLLLIEASSEYYQSNIQKAVRKLNRALSLFVGIEEHEKSVLHWELRAKTLLGMCRLAECEYAKAMYLFFEVKDAAVEHNDIFNYVYAYLHLGIAYTAIGKYTKALQFLKAAEEASDVTGSNHQKGLVHLSLGNIFSQMGQCDTAMNHLQEALAVFDENSFAETPEVLATMGGMYLSRKDYLRAEQFLVTALDLSRSKGAHAAEAEVLLMLAKVDTAKGRASQSIDHLNQALCITRDYGMDRQSLEISRILMEHYEQSGNFEKAYQCSRMILDLNNELIQKNIISDIRIMELSYKLEKIKADRDFLKKRTNSLKRSYDLIHAVSALGDEVNSLLDIDLVIETMYSKLKQFLPVDAFALLFYDPENNELNYQFNIVAQKYVRTNTPIVCTSNSSIEAYCARSRKGILIRNIEEEGFNYRKGPIPESLNVFRSRLLVPLETRGELLGIMSIQAVEEDAYSAGDMDILKILGNQVAVATANFRVLGELQLANEVLKDDQERLRLANRNLQDAHAKIEQLAIYDTLTGLPNRHLLFERALPMLLLARRNTSPFAVCFIDLDNFKQINDSLGHWAGDEALRILSRRMIKALRKSDLVARIGGDEFVAVFSDLKKKEDIKIILEKLIREIGKPLVIGREQFSVGASIGVSFHPEDGYDFSNLLNMADKAQYMAKNQGKNRYCIYSETAGKGKSLLKHEIS